MSGTGLLQPGLPAEGGRRFLLTGVISRYHLAPSWNREELAEDLRRMVELFTGELGYEHVPVMSLDPTSLQIREALRDFCTSPERQPDDFITVYLAGHGEILQLGDIGGEHVLLPADADPDDLRRRAVKSADLAEWMLADTPVRRLLLIVDACYSGLGGLDFARNALARMGTPVLLSHEDGYGIVVVTATQPAQRAIAGAFTAAFARAVRHQATAGHVPGALSIDAVMRVLSADSELPPSQRAQWSFLAGSGAVPDFLLNPRRDSALVDLDLAEQDRRWRAQLEHEHQRAEEMRGQFIPRIAGFTGRHRALIDIANWLDTPADARPMIVTGDPGSGKTAVLGILAALADPRRRPTISRDGLPADAIPRQDAVDVAIYAGNLTTGQVLAGLATAAGIDDIDPDPAALVGGLARLLSGLRQGSRPLTAMIDALDEAADPLGLAGELLRPLIERGGGLIRLLLGTRRHVCDHLGRGWKDRCEVIDLDSGDYADPEALAVVVRHVLVTGTPATGTPTGGTPFASCPRAVLDAVTVAIAEAAGHSFFVARILAATQASRPAVPDPADRAWRTSLPKTAGPAMRQDLELRLGDEVTRAVDLLRPLAYAQGIGLPWEDVWALLANALTPGHAYTNEDLLWLAGHAGSFIVEGGTIAGRSAYRLYHRSLAEDLIAGRDQAADQHAITTALAAHVRRRFNGRPDWPVSHPYIRAYLATHAARSGDIDGLAQDPGFLLAADPPQLLAALDTAASTPARSAGGAYRSALPLIRRHQPAERAAYLGLAARCGRAETLADHIDVDGLASPWRARWASWQLQRPHQQLTGHDRAVNAVAAAKLEGRTVVISGGDDGTVRVWDPATGALVGDPITTEDWRVNAVAAAELQGRPVVISGGRDRTVRVWDLATGDPVGDPINRFFFGGANALAAGEVDGRPVIISGGRDRWVWVWDLATGAPICHPYDGHDGAVNAVAVAELDGRPVVISGSSDRTVRIWDLATGTPIGRPLTGHRGVVNAVAAAELDGRPVVISGSRDRTVRVWDLATGDLIGRSLTGHDGVVNAVAVAELDGRPVVISGSSDQTMRLWDLATGAPIGDPLTGHRSVVNAVAAAELDGRPVVISGSSDQTVRVWDLAVGALAGDPFTGHRGAVNAVAAAEANSRPVLVSGSDDETVRVWDLATGALVGDPFTGHRGAVNAVAATELDGRPVVISGSSDRTVRIWDLATGTPIGRPLTGHRGAVNAVAVAEADGRAVLISGGDDGTVRVWDPATGARVGRPFTGHRGPVNAVAPAELDGRAVVISGSGDGTIRVWDLATGTPVGNPLTGHGDWVRSVAVGEVDGHPVVISGGDDGTVRVWDLATGAPVGDPFTGHDGWVFAVAAAEVDGRPVAISGGRDRTVRVWDLATGAPVGDPLTGHEGWVFGVTAGELDGRPVIVSGSRDRTMGVWDPATGVWVGRLLTGHRGAVNAVAAGEVDGRPVIVSGGDDRTVRVWDLATGTPVGDPFTGHDGTVNAVAAGKLDGRPVAISGGGDRTVRVWDLATGTPVGDPLTGHDDWVRSVAVGEVDGRPVIVSGGDDRTVRVWDLATGTPVGDPLTGHDGWVRSVAVGEVDGRPVIVSGGDDRTVRVWDLATGTPVGDPLTGHAGAVNAVTATELDGRPVAISGGSDGTAKAWALATGDPVGDLFIGHAGTVQSLAVWTAHGSALGGKPVRFGGGVGNLVAASTITALGDALRSEQTTTELGSNVLAVAWGGTAVLVAGTELGIVTLEFPQ